jgi:serine/threonine-protein kinase
MSNLIDRFKGAFSHIAKARGQWQEPTAPEAIDTSLDPALLAKLASALSGSYRIEKEVGAGGMALVFQARDLKHDREVALKVLKPDLASRLGRERFLREIQMAARLTHPHILPLHDSGDASGLLYYVMPHVAGPSLKDRLKKEGPLPAEEAVDIARAVASALDYAHRQGVVHRDIKPANIMMNQGVAVVTDFGIGKAISEAGAQGAQLTQEGMLVGTPAYMSPEQTKERGEIDGRSDIYSLGLVLHELLTGEPLFTGPTPIALLVRRASQAMPELSYPGEVPHEVRHAVHTALAESPDERFATGADFVTALVGAQRALSDTFTPPATPAQSAEISIAVLPFSNMSGDPENEYFSDGVTEEIINSLTKLGGLRVAARTSSFAFKGQSPDIKEAGRRLNVSTVLEGSVRQSGDQLRVTAQLINVADGYHLWSERWDRQMDDVFAVQDEIAGAIADRLKVTLSASQEIPARPTSNVEAYQLYLKGRHLWNHRDEDSLLKAVDYFEKAIERDPEFAHAYSGLADTYLLMGSYRIIDRGEAHEKAKAAALKACELDDSLAEAHTSMGQVLRRERDWEGEERAYKRAIELNPNYATAHQWYATLLAALGRMDEAVQEARRAEELDPLSHAILVTSAIVFDLARDVDCALNRLKRALELEPEFASAIGYSGYVYAQRGMFDEAFKTNEKMAEKWGDEEGGVTAHRATIYALMGDQEKGRELLEKAIEQEVDPGYAAFVWTALGEYDLAFEWLDRAVDENSWFVFHMKVHPALDPLRPDPRFDKLLDRVGLAGM